MSTDRGDVARETLFYVTQVAPYRDGPAGVHGVLPQSEAAMAELAGMAGLGFVSVRDVSELPGESIEGGGILALFTIGEVPWSEPQRKALAVAVRSGRMGVLGIHAATDSCHGWSGYRQLVGARFDGHPWTQSFEVEVADRSHPATAHLGERWPWHDEVYIFRDLRPDAHVLLRVADGQLDMGVGGARVPECGFPLAWCFEEGEGRCIYTSLGHFPAAWESPGFLRHLAGALDWTRRS